MTNIIAVFLGCGFGGVARYTLTRYASEHFFTTIPSGTLIVNIAGSFLIGFFFALFKDSAVPAPLRLLVTTGFLGGFTTFSTYALETMLLLEKGQARAAAMNFLTHNCLGFLAVFGGILVYAAIRIVMNGGHHA